mgnify:CR=1 FL=1
MWEFVKCTLQRESLLQHELDLIQRQHSYASLTIKTELCYYI